MDVERGAENLKKAKSWQEKARKKKVDNFYTSQFYAFLGNELIVFYQTISGDSGNSCSGSSSDTPSRYTTHTAYIMVKLMENYFLSTFNYKVKICIFSNYYFL